MENRYQAYYILTYNFLGICNVQKIQNISNNLNVWNWCIIQNYLTTILLGCDGEIRAASKLN